MAGPYGDGRPTTSPFSGGAVTLSAAEERAAAPARRHERARVGIGKTCGMDYWDAFPDLAGLVLEESWVLDLLPSERSLAVRLDAVMTEEHPQFEPPAPGERYSYLSGWLTLASDESLAIQPSGALPARDASGETDLGHVDRLLQVDEECWEVEGEWGSVRMRRPVVSFAAD